MIPEELLEQTSYYQKWTHRGRQEGREQGREEGRAQASLETSRAMVKRALTGRFPSLAHRAAEIDSLTSTRMLDHLMDQILVANDAAAASGVLDQSLKEASR